MASAASGGLVAADVEEFDIGASGVRLPLRDHSVSP